MLRIFIVSLLLAGAASCHQPKPTAVAKGGALDRGSHSPKVTRTFLRHKEDLYRLSGVTSVWLREWAILVYTDNPAIVPQEIDGVLVRTFPAWGGTSPMDERSQAWALVHHREGLLRLPGVQDLEQCNGVIYVHTDNPAVVPAMVQGVPIKVISSQLSLCREK